MGGDKKAKIMGQTTKEKLGERPVSCGFRHPRKKIKKRPQFQYSPPFFSDSNWVRTKGQTHKI